MKIDDKGNLLIGIDEIVAGMNAEQRADIAKTAAFQEEVIAGVVAVLTNRGGITDDGWYLGGQMVEAIRLKLPALLPVASRLIVEDLLNRAKKAEHERERIDTWAWKLYHAFPREGWCLRPEVPFGYVPPPKATQAEIDGYLPLPAEAAGDNGGGA